jgi:hypothetical protein
MAREVGFSVGTYGETDSLNAIRQPDRICYLLSNSQ